jgi:mersacidin/lichenicidin family type 2 lantibiotic
MNSAMVVKAWRDPIFRQSLDMGILSQFPVNPAGDIEVQKFRIRFLGDETNSGISNSCGGDCSSSAGGTCCGNTRKPKN